MDSPDAMQFSAATKGRMMAITIQDLGYEGETPEQIALYAAIGRILVLWGQFEMGFDGTLMMLSRDDPKMGKSLRDVFGVKLDLWRSAFDQKPNYREDAFLLADEAQKLAERRNEIIHTNWGNLFAQPKETSLTGGRLKFSNGDVAIVTAERRIGELYELTEEIAALQFRLTAFMLRLPQ